jgi:DNA-binding HxlR family transcriptional regulator
MGRGSSEKVCVAYRREILNELVDQVIVSRDVRRSHCAEIAWTPLGERLRALTTE